MNEQIAFSFDKVTLIKILKGAGIAAGGAAALAVLDFIGALKIDNPLFASFIAFLVPTLINVIKEWMKGKN